MYNYNEVCSYGGANCIILTEVLEKVKSAH